MEEEAQLHRSENDMEVAEVIVQEVLKEVVEGGRKVNGGRGL